MSAQRTAVPFGYPEVIDSQGVHLASKTRRPPDGRFEAVAAIFAWGRRGLTLYAVAETRRRSQREAEMAAASQSALRTALSEGRVSYTARGAS